MIYYSWYQHACKYSEHLQVQIFVNIYLCIRVLINLHNKILHKYEFGQVHCVDLTKGSQTKFSLPFFDIPQVSTNFGSLLIFLGLNKSKNKFLICAQC
jgi:hypothetical protein